MSTRVDLAWRDELGLGTARAPAFFGSIEDLDRANEAVPHAHVVRRAFNLLELDGVVCDQAAPLVYFKVVDHVLDADLLDLHRRFWNHGGAPILVVVAPSEVHVYSGFARPSNSADAEGRLAGLITRIDRASSELRTFLPSVASGEFFHTHAKSFNQAERVDQALLANLQATREKLAAITARKTTADVLDAFLCRLVFTCYLFDREVIGQGYLEDLNLRNASHLRDVLGLKPRSSAKSALYRLFAKLAKDFNGDLFSDDLDAEASLVKLEHIEEVDEFFRGTDIRGGQRAFWPYDFEAIPIETISAIYERFLKSAEKTGAFYTPRFLAELVLDLALSDRPSLRGLRFLDPACGSGIFLVGLFNRLAEEWKRANPDARNDRRARELMALLRSSLYGIDFNPTACRITAFSLYLAYLDQLEPRDIQELQAKGRALPNLIRQLHQSAEKSADGGIWCGDFFKDGEPYPTFIDVTVGNPPWGSHVRAGTEAARWLEKHGHEIPDGQIAAAFMWKAAEHTAPDGRICFLVPHGILYNHSRAALDFQKSFLKAYALDRVLNLTDYQFFLFSEARHPALVVSYRNREPGREHKVKHWAPKTDWKMLRAEIITISELDQSVLMLPAILRDLEGDDAPQIWKRMSTASPRDRRLLDRLSDLPRLRERVRQPRDRQGEKPWLIAEGFQPFGENDSPSSRRTLQLPGKLFIPASSDRLRLFVLPEDCETRRSDTVTTRRTIRDPQIFRAPHVLVSKGFGSIAYADFDVSFQHALRGVAGPKSDRHLLMFLASYMRSPLAQYFQFHTSSNWGVSRQEVHVEELLRLPFPLPKAMHDPERGRQIVDEVASIVQTVMRESKKTLIHRESVVDQAQRKIDTLIYEYFDITDTERILIEDSARLAFESFRPSVRASSIPTIEPSTPDERERYTSRLCQTLNEWARSRDAKISGSTSVSSETGIGLVMLERGGGPTNARSQPKSNGDLLAALENLRAATSIKSNTFELARGIKVFDGPRLYIVKPLGRRYWSESAALNDADEIAGSILMQISERLG